MDLDEKNSGLFRWLLQFEADPNKNLNIGNLNIFYLKLGYACLTKRDCCASREVCALLNAILEKTIKAI